ncbi:YkvA family protein [Azomonas macrocytogenes]|uniref:Uncharacterized membrane protein YkvA (DUF1232 family) n=1 Tax=Azomonas macrocytogenes TaxID=69962 RepID=A0A839T3Z2_AZOMA|nr:YkvA family protein [Azomonas macrocytogenes]MBB3104132.1 uncharacterized membrane protein YkvA (DUF1232 family) [Azomonas macrocytogenes]
MKEFWGLIRYLPMARAVLAKGRLPALLLAVARKRSSSKGMLSGMKENLRLLQALCVAWWRGEYRAVSPQAMIAVVAALIYFLSPLDILPEVIPVLGFIDDFAVLSWVMRKWSVELDAFRAWQEAQSPERQADLERLPLPEEPKA